MNELISIIVVNYNGKKWLQNFFDSFLVQTHKNYEIIFVDNASTDDSIEFIEENYKDLRIRTIKSDKNLGFAGGNNLGIKNAKGEFILLINNDVWVERDFLEKILVFYINNKFDVVAPYENDYENKVKREYKMRIDFFGHTVYENKNSKDDGFYLSGACLFFKKDLYYETMGLDNNFFMYFEEVDWFWRLNLLGKKFSYIKDSFIHHAGAGSTGGGLKYLLFLWRNQNTLQMLLKNYHWHNLLWVLPIYFIQNIFEILYFLLIFRFKIAISYFQGWWFNFKNIKKILEKRKWIQKNRLVSDFHLMRRMYIGFGKLKHLLAWKG